MSPLLTSFNYVICFYLIFGTSQSLNPQQSKTVKCANWEEQLAKIRQTSKETGLPQKTLPVEELCLSCGCFETSFELLNALNTSVNPCKNFYQFSCGNWIANNPIPADRSSSDRITQLIRRVNNLTRYILSDEPEDPAHALPINQAKQFYKKCADVETVEKVGLAPLKALIAQLGGWQLLNPKEWNASGFNYTKAIAETLLNSYNFKNPNSDAPIFNFFVLDDLKNSTYHTLYLDQQNFGILPREILIAAENYTKHISAYKNLIYEIAQELGSTLNETELRAEAESILNFEISLANIAATEAERRNMARIYNPFKLNEYQAITDTFDPTGEFTISWKGFLDEIFKDSGITIAENESVIVTELDYLKKLIPILKQTDTKILNNFIIFKFILTCFDDTTKAMRDIKFRIKQAITGMKKPKEREEECVEKTNFYLGFATSARFIESGVFDEESKEEMTVMGRNLLSTFKEMVWEAGWMQNVTKQEAINKAEVFKTFLGYPDWLKNKTALEHYYNQIELNKEGTYFQGVLKMHMSSTKKALKKLREPTDKNRWMVDPVTVNAGFYPTSNAITYAAAILQPPFFRKDFPKHQNYGTIGAVIGHEITHGFDDVGAKFDLNGNYNDWWDNVTRAEYEKRSECMINQYSKYYVERAELYLNGKTTLGENIGDNGGLRESYRAYQKYVKENGEELRLPGMEMFTPEQLFYMGWASIWCKSTTKEGLIAQVMTDPHSVAEFRTVGPLKNSDLFAKAYNCPVDPDGMNPPTDQKCEVW